MTMAKRDGVRRLLRAPTAWCAFVFALTPNNLHAQISLFDSLAKYNVVWNTKCTLVGDSSDRGFMPVGNGVSGLNVWVDANNPSAADQDLCLYIDKNDAFRSTDQALCKLGKVRIHLTPNPFSSSNFKQTLDLATGTVTIIAGASWEDTVRVWSDPYRAAASYVEVSGAAPVSVRAVWATRWRSSDTIVAGQTDRMMWFFRNSSNANQYLANLTCGAAVKGRAGTGLGTLTRESDTSIVSSGAAAKFAVGIYAFVEKAASSSVWKTDMAAAIAAAEGKALDSLRVNRNQFWSQFWERSWIFIRGGALDTTFRITQAYLCNRYSMACAQRGYDNQWATKFNGSMFITYRPQRNGVNMTPDDRAWGGTGYWTQNTRHLDWPMLQSGDYDILQPYFNQYCSGLPSWENSVMSYYGHTGAWFQETVYWDNITLPNRVASDSANWNVFNYQPILELSVMMLDRYYFTGDSAFLKNQALRTADDAMLFFQNHFGLVGGKLNVSPCDAAEMWRKTTNPANVVAGIAYVLKKLIALPPNLTTSEQKTRWLGFQSQIPSYTTWQKNGLTCIRPYAGWYSDSIPPANSEDPELYVLWPYKMVGLGKPDWATAQNTYKQRGWPNNAYCWFQNGIWAACMGDSAQARYDIRSRFADTSYHTTYRFPGFYNDNNDYAPDMDQAGAGANGLQQMLVQYDERDSFYVLPAWPKGWSVDFKLWGPKGNAFVGSFKNGSFSQFNCPSNARPFIRTAYSLPSNYDAPPTVGSAASANPALIAPGGGTSELTVLGSHDPESELVYTWKTIGVVPAPVSLDINECNKAKTTTAAFTADGTYQILAIITDMAGQSCSTSVTVTVGRSGVLSAGTELALEFGQAQRNAAAAAGHSGPENVMLPDNVIHAETSPGQQATTVALTTNGSASGPDQASATRPSEDLVHMSSEATASPKPYSGTREIGAVSLPQPVAPVNADSAPEKGIAPHGSAQRQPACSTTARIKSDHVIRGTAVLQGRSNNANVRVSLFTDTTVAPKTAAVTDRHGGFCLAVFDTGSCVLKFEPPAALKRTYRVYRTSLVVTAQDSLSVVVVSLSKKGQPPRSIECPK